MKPDSDEILSIWTDFSQALRPEIDSVCFYPESSLPFSKSEIFLMLVDNYQWVKNEASDYEDENGLKINLTEISKDLPRYQDAYTLFQSLAINIGYLARFTDQVEEKYITRFGSQVLKALSTDNSIEAIISLASEGPKSDPEKEQQLLFEFFKILETYSAITGFNIQKLMEWNPIMSGVLQRLAEKRQQKE
jgi:hypothetical protein